MLAPDDPLAPPGKAFDEPWQAQALALAETMVMAGHFSAEKWSETLGATLREAEARGAPDTLATYYTAVVTALERLCQEHLEISAEALSQRRSAWEEAYRRTTHGEPVEL